jgi:hypothetical protein
MTPPKQPSSHHSSEPTSQYIHQSHPIPVPARVPPSLVYPPSTHPQLITDIQETVDNSRRESPRCSIRQLDLKPPTSNIPNNYQLGVMRLDQLSDPSYLDSPPSHPSPSEPSRIPSPASTPPPTEFLLQSAQSPSIGLSSLPSTGMSSPMKKPILACFFCRGRKIQCGAPLPGSIQKTCKSVSLFFLFIFISANERFLANAGGGVFNAITLRRVDGG